LKYRLAHTGEDATQEFAAVFADRKKFQEILDKVVPLSIADGLAAVTYVRQHASDWGVPPIESALSDSPLAERSPPELPSVSSQKAAQPS